MFTKVSLSSLHFCLNTKKKFHEDITLQTCNNIFKFHKTQLNQRTLRNMQPHLICWYTKIWIFIKRTIWEGLVKIQYFRHEYSSIMYENTQKRNKINVRSITCSDIWHFKNVRIDKTHILLKFGENMYY